MLSHNKVSFIEPSKYVDELYELIKTRNIYKVDFQDLCNMSYVYQYLLSEKMKILKFNSSASFLKLLTKHILPIIFLPEALFILLKTLEIFKEINCKPPDNKINHMQELISVKLMTYNKYEDDKF